MKLNLYPYIEPYNHFYLKVSEIHEIYVEECGNPKGSPILFLHGGPGAGLSPEHRRFFDPRFYRIILFDQRGAGKSKPYAELKENTTWDLVEDIEKIRKKLGINSWVVFGGSWGSTLALTYAETHPKNVLGLILRGIFLCRETDLIWFYQYGAHHIFPDFWEDYKKPIPVSEQNDFIKAYYKRLTSSDKKTQLEAAQCWSQWEGRTIKLVPEQETIDKFAVDIALSLARIECHYFINKCWFSSDNQLVENANIIKNTPCEIIHGRYDVCTPINQAFDLLKNYPKANFTLVPDAGHAASEVGIIDGLVRATEKFKNLF